MAIFLSPKLTIKAETREKTKYIVYGTLYCDPLSNIDESMTSAITATYPILYRGIFHQTFLQRIGWLKIGIRKQFIENLVYSETLKNNNLNLLAKNRDLCLKGCPYIIFFRFLAKCNNRPAFDSTLEILLNFHSDL